VSQAGCWSSHTLTYTVAQSFSNVLGKEQSRSDPIVGRFLTSERWNLWRGWKRPDGKGDEQIVVRLIQH